MSRSIWQHCRDRQQQGRSRQTTRQGKKAGIEAPEKEKKSRGERKGGSAAGYRCWSKKYAFTPFKRSFLAISSGIPLIMPAQNGKREEESATIPAKPRAEREQPETCHNWTRQKKTQGNNGTPTVWTSRKWHTLVGTTDQDINKEHEWSKRIYHRVTPMTMEMNRMQEERTTGKGQYRSQEKYNVSRL